MTDDQLDRLEQLLAAPEFGGDALQLDELQGFLCALVSGPEAIAAEVWQAAALGGEAAEVPAELTDLLLRLHAEIAEILASGEAPDLILYDGEDGQPDYRSWCDGYLYGAQAGAIDWNDAAGEHVDDLGDLMQPFFVLNDMIKEDALKHNEPWLPLAKEQALYANAREALPEVVRSVYEFWQAARLPEQVRREAPKVGRNDPCPCGSGKKFKQCCGAGPTVH